MADPNLDPLLKAFGELAKSLKQILAPFADVASSFTLVGASLKNVFTPFQNFANQLKLVGGGLLQFGGALPGALANLGLFATHLLGVNDAVKAAFIGLSGSLQQSFSSIWTTVANAIPTEVKNAFSTLGSTVLAGFSNIISGLASIFAGVANLILGSLGPIKDMVGAFSPAVVEMFNEALRNVMAVVGQALVPILTVLTGVLNQASGIIAPLMDELAPVIQQVAESLASALIPVIRAVVGIIHSLMPIIKIIALLFDNAAKSVAVLATVFEVVFETLSPLFEMFADIMKWMMDTVRSILKAMLEMALEVLKWVPYTAAISDKIKDVIAKLDRGPTSRVTAAAAQNVSEKSFADYQRDLQKAAFAATATGKTSTEQNVTNMAGWLKAIVDNGVKINGQSETNNNRPGVAGASPDEPGMLSKISNAAGYLSPTGLLSKLF